MKKKMKSTFGFQSGENRNVLMKNEKVQSFEKLFIYVIN